MDSQLEEALEFFGLDKDFTRDDWSDTYRLLSKEIHPDINYDTEEYMKLVNKHKAVLRNYELQNRTVIKKRLDDKKERFRKQLQDDKKKYNYFSITSLINEYLIKLNEIEGFKKLEELKKSYAKRLNDILINKKQSDELNFRNKKESFKKYFLNKFMVFCNSHDLKECLDANKILGSVFEILDKATALNIDEVIKLIGNISFEDIKHDQNILNGLNINYEVYINKNHGNYVLVEKIDDNDVYYRKNIKSGLFSVNRRKFNHDFLSLKSFIEESEYVGNHDVYMIGRGIYRRDLPLSRYLYYHYRSGLMLIYKEDEIDGKFSFYSGNVSYPFEDISYQFEIDFNSKRSDPENGKFKNRDFLYEMIMNEIISLNSDYEFEENKSKK